jgi:hypothetical protein
MKPTQFYVLSFGLVACATVLIALGKLPAEVFLPLVAGVLGWAVPSPVKKALP